MLYFSIDSNRNNWSVKQKMDLRFLGRGAAFNVREGNTSAYLMEDDRLLLLDCGELVFSRLLEKGLLVPGNSVDLCLTHLHCDHVGSLGTLILYCRFVLEHKPRLILPEDETYRASVRTLLRIMGCTEELYTVSAPGDVKEYSSFRSLRYVPAVHEVPEVYTAGQQAFSLVFETEKGGVFYSGDTCTVGPLKDFLTSHPDPELICVDTTDADFYGNVHLNLKLLGEAVPPELRSRVRMMHINRPSCAQTGLAMGFGLAEL